MAPSIRRRLAQLAVLAFVASLAVGGAVPAAPVDAASASAIVPGSVGRTSLALRATYDVSASLGFDARTLRVDATLTVRNDSGAGIDRLELDTVAARLGNMRRLSASVDGHVVIPTRSDQTVTVPLGGVLPAGATAKVYVGYSAALRSGTSGSDWLFTRANGIVDLYRWIPWVSRAKPFDRPNHGDPFVTPVSPKVTLTLKTDRALVVAATGRQTAVSGLTQTFEATNVRDLVLTAAPDYRTASRHVDGVFLQAFVRPGTSAGPRLDAAARALHAMRLKLGAPPYDRLLVAQSAGGFGMEGPGTVWVPTGVASSNLPYLVTHETAHQWFYALVGNDQAVHPFTDEAAADFVTRTVLGSFRGSGCSTGYLDRSIYEYSSACYYETVYVQGASFLDSLRRRIGDTKFWPALRGYLAAYRWKLAPPTALLDAIDDASSLDLTGSYRARFPRWY